MRRVLPICFALLLGYLPGSIARADDAVPGEIVVRLKSGTDIDQFNLWWGTRLLSRENQKWRYKIAYRSDVDGNLLAALMRLDSRVQTANRNSVMRLPLQANLLTATPQWTSTFNGSDGPQAYSGQGTIPLVNFNLAALLANGSGVTVAFVDTGMSTQHPFLAAQAVPGYNFVNNNSYTEDAPTGTDSNNNGIYDEATGHGTMLAGLVYRFAPAAHLMPVRVLDSDGSGTLWAAVQGIDYAVSHGAKIINISWGASDAPPPLVQAISDARAAGVLVVCSAGNSNSNWGQYPATDPNTLTVASLNDDGTKALFSNYGIWVGLDAPGVNIVSTFWDGRYAAWSGTSFSAPMVAAEAALVMSRNPALTADAVQLRLLTTSHSVDALNPFFAGQLGQNGAGLIDFDAALSGL
jgi:subtilisin family serine protease